MRSSSFSTPARPRLMVAMSCTLLLLLIGIPAPATGLLGNLACSGHLLQNCGGANLVLESLQPPYDEKPEFCAPACVAAAASGPCEGTETGAGLVRSCDSLDCIGPASAPQTMPPLPPLSSPHLAYSPPNPKPFEALRNWLSDNDLLHPLSGRPAR